MGSQPKTVYPEKAAVRNPLKYARARARGKNKTYSKLIAGYSTTYSSKQLESMQVNKAIIDSVSKTGCIVTAEEHNHLGGLGESVSRVLAQHRPTPQEFVATNDTFGESGTPAQLMDKYGLNSNAIQKAVKTVLKRK